MQGSKRAGDNPKAGSGSKEELDVVARWSLEDLSQCLLHPLEIFILEFV